MKQAITTGIILRRTNFGEADRILTVLTPDHGKLRLKARGVRKIKSKLAGGIELFSTSHLTFIEGRGEGLGTLISTRLIRHYGHIAHHLERVQLGYDLIRILDRATEDHPEQEYYALLEQAFAALDDADVDLVLIQAWFQAQLLKLAGHTPNLNVPESKKYNFDFENMTFVPDDNGRFAINDIKFLRLLLSGNRPAALARVEGRAKFVEATQPLVNTMFQTHLHL